MFTCPHCGQLGISLVQKAILSPGFLATCNTCGATSSVRYPSWLASMMPGSILIILAMLVDSDSLEWSLNIIGLILMVAIPLIYTPLHKEY